MRPRPPALAAALLFAAAPADAQAPVFRPRPCPPGLQQGARCGSVEVPENREAPAGRSVALNVVVLPARTGAPAREALTFFGGGPGQAVSPMARWLPESHFDALRDERDLLLVDQRGTGGSSPLQCTLRDPANPQSYLDDFLPPGPVARCRDELARRADLSRYGFMELAHDVEAVRRALGYARLDLWGGSYGTRAAQAYMRAYPRNVRSAVLHGVVPSAYLQPKDYARDTDAALAGLYAECRADAACSAAFPHAEAELREVARRLEQGPATAQILDPRTGRRVRLSLSRGTFAEIVRRMLYDPTSARAVPFLVHRAHQGDYGPFLSRALQERRNMDGGSWWGLYLALTCREDVPFIDSAAAAMDNGRTLLGDYRVRQQAAACRGWPRAAERPEYQRPPTRLDVPALLVSGELDPVTPARGGDSVLPTLPNGVHVVVPGGAHGFGGMRGAGCVDSLVVRFLRQGHARGLDPEPCIRGIRPPPFLTDEPEPVSLDAQGLARLAGVYASAQPPLQVRIDALDGALRVVLSSGPTLLAAPLSHTEFRVEGLAPGHVMAFSADAGTLTVRLPDEPDLVLTRKP